MFLATLRAPARRMGAPRLLRAFSALSATPKPVGPLAGIRVLDFTRILAGPWCTQLLGDMGADVIKVEALTGDDTRSWGPPFIDGMHERRQSSYFLCANRNKRSVAIDIKSAAGRSALYELVKRSDVFVENFVPGKLDALGYGHQRLREINPALIYGSISGFGADGPLAQRPGYDVGIAAQGGLMSITGPEDGAPCKVGVAVTDISTGLYMHGAILAALFARERDPARRGTVLTTSLLEAQIANLANIASNVLNSSWPTRRWGTAHESIVPYQVFRASDGAYFVLAAMSDAQFSSLCMILGRPELATDERFRTNPQRVKHRAELISILEKVLETRPRQQWIDCFASSSVTVTPVNSVQEALQDPQVLHREMVVEMPHEALGGNVKLTGMPVKYAGEVGTSLRLPPPLLGEHTRAVLTELAGLSDSDVDELVRRKVVRVLPPPSAAAKS